MTKYISPLKDLGIHCDRNIYLKKLCLGHKTRRRVAALCAATRFLGFAI
ncbi:hypothetical protein H6F41_08090 [Pseudanabaena sp. FACHB-723]|uniref:30S ribosomal protein S18 n=1 Tax=Pseudanabaena mucicola FACHB-723 TaxID=2692860 RepID=A0ABR7ZWA2_9CYAN|nr:hypothetical protein [Pseudanabaena mucicola FACHB-723]